MSYEHIPLSMTPEFYIFIDEQPKQTNQRRRTIVSAIVTEQHGWRSHFKKAALVGQTRNAKKLPLISQLLIEANGVGVVMYADTEFYDGVKHYTDEIPEMAANDNVWSIVVACAIARGLRWLGDNVSKSALIDVYHDPKDLTDEHRAALEDYIRRRIVVLAKEKKGYDFSPKRIEQVPKRNGKSPPDIFQQGVMIADHLCSNTQRLISGDKYPRIICENANIDDILILFGVLGKKPAT